MCLWLPRNHGKRKLQTQEATSWFLCPWCCTVIWSKKQCNNLASKENASHIIFVRLNVFIYQSSLHVIMQTWVIHPLKGSFNMWQENRQRISARMQPSPNILLLLWSTLWNNTYSDKIKYGTKVSCLSFHEQKMLNKISTSTSHISTNFNWVFFFPFLFYFINYVQVWDLKQNTLITKGALTFFFFTPSKQNKVRKLQQSKYWPYNVEENNALV